MPASVTSSGFFDADFPGQFADALRGAAAKDQAGRG